MGQSSISPYLYKKNCHLIGPIQEEHPSFKRHPSRCVLVVNIFNSLSLDRQFFPSLINIFLKLVCVAVYRLYHGDAFP